MSRERRISVSTSTLLPILVVACVDTVESGASDRKGFTGDSAEIETVEVGGGLLDDLPEWSLQDRPLVEIGERVAEDPYMFSRIDAAVMLPSGEFVVLDGVSLEFRVFGPDGLFRRRFGRDGEGPGEFKAASVWRLVNGGFAVADDRLNRLTVFDSTANLTESRRGICRSTGASVYNEPPNYVGSCAFAGLTGDGHMFWSETVGSEQPPLRPDVAHHYVGGMRFLVRGSGDATLVVDSIPVANEVAILTTRFGPRYLWVISELFEPNGNWAFGARTVAVAEGGRFEVRFRDSAGSLQRILRVDVLPERVTTGHVDAIRQLLGTAASLSPAELALDYLNDVTVGGPMPFIGKMRFDQSGRLWIAGYVPDPVLVVPKEWRWTIIDENGLPLARMTTGPSDDILEIGDDYMLLRERDDMDVESMAMYRIERGPAR